MHWHGFSSVWVLQWQQTYTASHINAVSVVIGLSPVCPNTNFKAKFILPVRWANPREITLNWIMWGLLILVLCNKWEIFVTLETSVPFFQCSLSLFIIFISTLYMLFSLYRAYFGPNNTLFQNIFLLSVRFSTCTSSLFLILVLIWLHLDLIPII